MLDLHKWWRALNHQRLVDKTFKGYDKHTCAEAIRLLIFAAASMLPLMVSDTIGLERRCRRAGTYHTGKTSIRYYRDWKKGRR